MKAAYLLIAALGLGDSAAAQVLKANLPAASAPSKSQPTSTTKPRTVVRTRTVYRDRPVYVERPVVATVPGYSLTDHFYDNSYGWCTGSDDLGNIVLENGKYTIQCNQQQGSNHCSISTSVNNNSDFTCNVTVQWKEGITDNGFGIKFCGNEAQDSWYYFLITANGQFKVSYTDAQHTTTVPVLPWKESALIFQNSVPNILRVMRQGDFVHFFINGSEVGAIPFDGGYGNRFGVTVFKHQTVAFDNFSVTGSRKP